MPEVRITYVIESKSPDGNYHNYTPVLDEDDAHNLLRLWNRKGSGYSRKLLKLTTSEEIIEEIVE